MSANANQRSSAPSPKFERSRSTEGYMRMQPTPSAASSSRAGSRDIANRDIANRDIANQGIGDTGVSRDRNARPSTSRSGASRSGASKPSGARPGGSIVTVSAKRTAAARPPASQPARFTGSLDALSVSDVLQIFQMSEKSGLIAIAHAGSNSWIWCQQGSIIDAQCGKLTGELALHRIVAMAQGQMSAKLGPVSRQRTINAPMQHLLLESARRQDEAAVSYQRLGGTAMRYRLTTAPTDTQEPSSSNAELSLLSSFGRAPALHHALDESALGELESLKLIESWVATGYLVCMGVATVTQSTQPLMTLTCSSTTPPPRRNSAAAPPHASAIPAPRGSVQPMLQSTVQRSVQQTVQPTIVLPPPARTSFKAPSLNSPTGAPDKLPLVSVRRASEQGDSSKESVRPLALDVPATLLTKLPATLPATLPPGLTPALPKQGNVKAWRVTWVWGVLVVLLLIPVTIQWRTTRAATLELSASTLPLQVPAKLPNETSPAETLERPAALSASSLAALSASSLAALSASSPAALSASSPAALSARPPEQYAVNLQVTPAIAQFVLDGQLSEGPLRTTMKQDGSVHELRLSAPGFIPTTVIFRDAPPPEHIELQPFVVPVATAVPSKPVMAARTRRLWRKKRGIRRARREIASRTVASRAISNGSTAGSEPKIQVIGDDEPVVGVLY